MTSAKGWRSRFAVFVVCTLAFAWAPVSPPVVAVVVPSSDQEVVAVPVRTANPLIKQAAKWLLSTAVAGLVWEGIKKGAGAIGDALSGGDDPPQGCNPNYDDPDCP